MSTPSSSSSVPPYPPPPLQSLPKTKASARGALAAPPLGGLSVFRVPCLSDNYAWVLVDGATGAVAVVDPAEAAPVKEFVESELGGRLDLILNTHHHGDHVGGNAELCDKFKGCVVVGAANDAKRIPRIGVRVSEGQKVQVGESEAVVLETPGHTSGHITFWFEKGKALFPVSGFFIVLARKDSRETLSNKRHKKKKRKKKKPSPKK